MVKRFWFTAIGLSFAFCCSAAQCQQLNEFELKSTPSSVITVKRYCEAWFENHQKNVAFKKSLLHSNFWKGFFEISFAKQKLASFKELDLVDASQKNDENPPTEWSPMGEVPGKKVVVSISPPDVNPDVLQYKQDESRAKQLRTKMKAYRRAFKKALFNANSVDDCQTRLKDSAARFSAFSKDAVEYNRVSYVRTFQRATRLSEVIRNIVKKFPQWTLVEAKNFQEVYKALSDQKVTAAILVAHSYYAEIKNTSRPIDPDAKLFDAAGHFFPHGFFSNLSPQLRVFGLFTCHSDAVVKWYGLEDELQKVVDHSSGSGRELKLVTSQLKPEVSFLEDALPVMTFPAYLKRIDHQSRGHFLMPNKTESNHCSVDIENYKYKNGVPVVLINGKYIGTLDQNSDHSHFAFLCWFTKNGTSTLILRNQDQNHDLDLDANQLKIFYSKNSTTDSIKSSLNVQNFYSDGEYSSSKAVF